MACLGRLSTLENISQGRRIKPLKIIRGNETYTEIIHKLYQGLKIHDRFLHHLSLSFKKIIYLLIYYLFERVKKQEQGEAQKERGKQILG